MFHPELQKNLRHNFTVNVLDGTFFGLALGLASSVTVLPLFVATLTDSEVLIGLIASVQMIGWNITQILTVNRVARVARYRPMVVFLTIQERWPIFALAGVALLIPVIHPNLALVLVFILFTWHAAGGGLTATAWQSMIAKIMPIHRRGTFWGIQGAGLGITMAIGTFASGEILKNVAYPYNYAICFFIASIAMAFSMGFLAWTREPYNEPRSEQEQQDVRWGRLWDILKADSNLRFFIVARMANQFAWMAVAFYSVYTVRRFGVDEATIGIIAAVLTLTQTVASPVLGWFGDRYGHRLAFALGNSAMFLSAGLAIVAPSVEWMYLVFALAGIAQPSTLFTPMAMTLEFGTERDRPYYIGLANTLIAPATILAPILGGWLARSSGFSATFALAVFMGILATILLLTVVKEPRHVQASPLAAPAIGD